MKRLIAIIAVAAVAGAGVALWLALAGGEGDARGVPAPATPAHFDIRGKVLSVTADPAAGLGSLLVRGEPLGSAGVDYASVRVTSDTEILSETAAGMVKAGFGDLAAGQTVKVALTGPVAESYPVQAAAGLVVIEG